jgi:hypothetical protein
MDTGTKTDMDVPTVMHYTLLPKAGLVHSLIDLKVHAEISATAHT